MTLYRTITIDKLTSITTRVNVLHLTGFGFAGIEVFQRSKFYKISNIAYLYNLL